MKIIAQTAFAISLILAGCNSPAKKVENARADLKDAQTELTVAEKDSVEDYNNFMKDAKLKIDANDKAIENLKSTMPKLSKSANINTQKRIDELEQKNIDMRKKMENYRANGKDEWESFKREFSYDMSELGKAIKNVGLNNKK